MPNFAISSYAIAGNSVPIIIYNYLLMPTSFTSLGLKLVCYCFSILFLDAPPAFFRQYNSPIPIVA